jgi:hypothetical protein
MDRDELKEKLAKQLYEWIDDDGWEWREITKTSRDVYRVKAAAILSLLAPILADAEKWRRVKECADSRPPCKCPLWYNDACNLEYGGCIFRDVVDALPDSKEDDDA